MAEWLDAHTRKKQIRTLQRNGTPHTINASGWPVVSIAVAEGIRTTEPKEGRPWRSKALAA